MAHTILRLPAVKSRTGLSRSSIYKFVAEGCFPSPVPLGARSVGWIEAEVDQWLRDRVEARRAGGVNRARPSAMHARSDHARAFSSGHNIRRA